MSIGPIGRPRRVSDPCNYALDFRAARRQGHFKYCKITIRNIISKPVMIFLAKDAWPDTVTRDDGNLKMVQI